MKELRGEGEIKKQVTVAVRQHEVFIKPKPVSETVKQDFKMLFHVYSGSSHSYAYAK